MKKYLLNEADRREIAALLSRQYSAPPPNPIKESQKVVHEEGDSYWALPTCEVGIQAGKQERLPDGSLSVSTMPSYCCLWRSTKQQNLIGGSILEPVLDINGVPVRVPVSDYHSRNQNDITQIWQKKDGSWSCEKPDVVSASNTTLRPGQNPGDTHTASYGCEGDCFWQADQHGVWQMPTGGCQNVTSTTTTTTSSPTTSYDPNNPGDNGLEPPVTVSPCINTKCTLVCIDTSTTPAPNEYGVPTPYQRFRYALKDGSVCPTGCTCYGLGDPCFLVEGELVSNCIGTGPTTTPAPTTPAPNSSPCSQADFIFGTASPDTYRSAINRQGAEFGTWQNCKQCPDGKYPLFRDFVYLREHNWDKLASVFESPCVASPCDEPRGEQMQNLIDISANQQDSQKYAIFRAYPYDRQLDLWKIDGVNKLSRDGTIRVDRDTNQFVANWFQCVTCPEGYRPFNPPPIWIDTNNGRGIVTGDGTDEGAWLDVETNTYIYYTQCRQFSDFDCDQCKRGRIFPPTVIDPPLPPGTTSTTSTTTKNPHCGCSRPSFCPKPFECTRTVCSKEGAAVFPSGVSQTTVPPSDGLPCFPSNTTTSTSTSTPSTTNAPNQCIGTDGRLCICPTQSTAPPSGGTCPPGYRRIIEGEPPLCGTIKCVKDEPPGPPPDPTCSGVCSWTGLWLLQSGSTYYFSGWTFNLTTGNNGSISASCVPPADTGITGSNGTNDVLYSTNCGCPRPSDAAANPPPSGSGSDCVRTAITMCSSQVTSTTSTTPNPCGCCSSTPDPCLTGYCRYSSTVSNTWTLRDNKCPTNCACPPASSVTLPISGSCDTITVACGYVFPPTTQNPTTQPPCSNVTCPTARRGVCCHRFTTNGSWFCVDDTCDCACAVGKNPTNPENPSLPKAVEVRFTNCTGWPGPGPCNCSNLGSSCASPTTTAIPKGACCVASRMGTAAPTWQCLNDTERTPCNQIGGLFFVNQDCSTDPCGLASTSTTSTTTFTPPTTTTTTNNPLADCCFRNSSPAYCYVGYGSSACIADGGVVISNCNACEGPTTTTTTTSTTTTTVGPGTSTTTTTTTTGTPPTTTPNPCDSCWAFQCGCSSGPVGICPPGTEFSCGSCGCVAATTPAPTTTTTTTTTTGAPPPL